MSGKAPAGTGYPSIAQIRANPIVDRKGNKRLTQLALDLSSSCVGWAVGANKKLERHGKLVFKSTAGTGEKLVSFEEYLEALIGTYWPATLLVEKPPSRMGDTTVRHAELLGITRKVWREITGSEIEKEWLIDPKVVKRVMNVKRGANHDENKKIMVNKINALYGLSFKFDKNSKIKTDDDTADAIAVLTTHWRRNAA